jgi:transposase-like protein
MSAELMSERGLDVDRSCIWRWVQEYLKVQGQDRYLWRAVIPPGQTIDFLLTARRDTESAKRF